MFVVLHTETYYVCTLTVKFLTSGHPRTIKMRKCRNFVGPVIRCTRYYYVSFRKMPKFFWSDLILDWSLVVRCFTVTVAKPVYSENIPEKLIG